MTFPTRSFMSQNSASRHLFLHVVTDIFVHIVTEVLFAKLKLSMNYVKV